jgi:hypothetical protein
MWERAIHLFLTVTISVSVSVAVNNLRSHAEYLNLLQKVDDNQTDVASLIAMVGNVWEEMDKAKAKSEKDIAAVRKAAQASRQVAESSRKKLEKQQGELQGQRVIIKQLIRESEPETVPEKLQPTLGERIRGLL